MKTNKRLIFNILIIFLIFFVDQISKLLIVNYLNSSDTVIYLTSFLNLQLVWNNGIAFGLLSFDNNLYYNLISLIIFIVIIVLLIFVKNQDNHAFFYSMIIGGALGNLIDRIRHSSVPDFIDFHISNFHWFVFNIADIFISLGVFCLIIAEIFFNKNNLNDKI